MRLISSHDYLYQITKSSSAATAVKEKELVIKKIQIVLLLIGSCFTSMGMADVWTYSVFGKNENRQYVASVTNKNGIELAIFCTATSRWPALMLYTPDTDFRHEKAGILRLQVDRKRSELSARYRNFMAFSPDVTTMLVDQLKQGNWVSVVRELPGGRTGTLRFPLRHSSATLNMLESECRV